jgi:hypothetical protein
MKFKFRKKTIYFIKQMSLGHFIASSPEGIVLGTEVGEHWFCLLGSLA